MIRDLDQAEREDALEGYDLCILGSGPAGMTLARELADTGLSICVLESGRLRPTGHGDALREVTSSKMPIKQYSRERVLGGASTTWSGLSSPYEEIDIGARSELDRAAWPVAESELRQLYARASDRYRFAPLPLFDDDGDFRALRSRGQMQPDWSELREKVFLAASDPQNFGKEHSAIFDGDGIDLWLDATAVQLEHEDSNVTGAEVRTRSGRVFRARARHFVVACGGIENARLLLASDGLGNAHDQVGRYFMNHPKNYRGVVHFTEPLADEPYWFGCLHKGFAGYGGLRLSEERLRREGLLHHYVRFEPMFPWTDNPGIEALVTMLQQTKGVMRFWKNRKRNQVVSLRDYSETGDDSDVKNARKGFGDWLRLCGVVLLHLPGVLHYLTYRLTPLVPKIKRARVRNFMEMEPQPSNRVTLGEPSGPYDQPMAVIHCELSPRDRDSLVTLHTALASELERTGAGRLESDLASADPWPITQDASHHMGTTRMGDDPEHSVVDANLGVHGFGNLSVAGASVFPTAGCANPTYTLVALSIRLADHLRSKLAPGAEAAQ